MHSDATPKRQPCLAVDEFLPTYKTQAPYICLVILYI